jgi:hypothetical protein
VTRTALRLCTLALGFVCCAAAPGDEHGWYVDGKRVPDEFRKKGAANPVKYAWL